MKREFKTALQMKERDVVEHFTRMWHPYPLHTIINTAEAGWPDKFLQLQHSTVVAIEFKMLQATTRRIYKLTTFRKEQAAWFAKWQRFGGYCMLFCGVNDHMGVFQGYDMITCTEYMDWIHVSANEYTLGSRELITTDKLVHIRMREWLRVRQLHANVTADMVTKQLTQGIDSGSHPLQERVDA